MVNGAPEALLHQSYHTRGGRGCDTMVQRERRKASRTASAAEGPVFVELRHTFGPTRKSVYKVLEHDEYGLSFLVPTADGYFAAGTPLQYALVKGDLSRTEGAGYVRYYHPYTDEVGTPFYKIGLEASTSFRDVTGGSYLLRPKRHVLEGKQYTRSIAFDIDGKEVSFELIDISPYSAAFDFNHKGPAVFRVSAMLPSARIAIEDTEIYDGPVTVTRIYQDKQERRRVVVEPRGALFDVGLIERHESIDEAVRESEALGAAHDSIAAIDTSFKATVADLRCLLEDYKAVLESPRYRDLDPESERTLLEQLFDPFYDRMDAMVTRLDDIVTGLKLDDEQTAVYRSYYQKHLLALLLASPLNHRSYFKPEGYPGDFETIRMIHDEGFTGPTSFAKLLNKYTNSVAVATVARKRTEYLAERILEFVRASSKPTVEVFSIASGPALEIDYIMKNHPADAKRISLTLLDQELHALRFSQDNLYANRIRYDSEIKLEFIHRGLEGFLRDTAEGKHGPGKYDFAYAFGLFDYFERDVARFVIRHLLPLIAPGGHLLISNISLDGHKYRTLAEFSFEWYLVYRDRELLMDLADGVIKDRGCGIQEIENGVMKFLQIQC